MTTCPRCPAEWSGLKLQHCAAPGCHQTFTGTESGDMHRTGRHDTSTGPDRRRCLTVEEMVEKGMSQNALGYWTNGRTSSRWWLSEGAAAEQEGPADVGERRSKGREIQSGHLVPTLDLNES